MFIWIFIAFFLAKAFRVHRSIIMLGEADAEAALRELLENGKTYFTSKDIIFTKHFAFFFKSGSIVAYKNIRRLSITNTQAPNTKFLIWNHDLIAKMTTGKWFLLVRDKVWGQKPNTTEVLTNYMNSLIEHNTEIAIE